MSYACIPLSISAPRPQVSEPHPRKLEAKFVTTYPTPSSSSLSSDTSGKRKNTFPAYTVGNSINHSDRISKHEIGNFLHENYSFFQEFFTYIPDIQSLIKKKNITIELYVINILNKYNDKDYMENLIFNDIRYILGELLFCLAYQALAGKDIESIKNILFSLCKYKLHNFLNENYQFLQEFFKYIPDIKLYINININMKVYVENKIKEYSKYQQEENYSTLKVENIEYIIGRLLFCLSYQGLQSIDTDKNIELINTILYSLFNFMLTEKKEITNSHYEKAKTYGLIIGDNSGIKATNFKDTCKLNCDSTINYAQICLNLLKKLNYSTEKKLFQRFTNEFKDLILQMQHLKASLNS